MEDCRSVDLKKVKVTVEQVKNFYEKKLMTGVR